jgi:hypothetical protein
MVVDSALIDVDAVVDDDGSAPRFVDMTGAALSVVTRDSIWRGQTRDFSQTRKLWLKQL